jgi:hypothetical protein
LRVTGACNRDHGLIRSTPPPSATPLSFSVLVALSIRRVVSPHSGVLQSEQCPDIHLQITWLIGRSSLVIHHTSKATCQTTYHSRISCTSTHCAQSSKGMQQSRNRLSNAAYAPETRPYCVINSACERHESVICVLFTNYTELIFMVPLGKSCNASDGAGPRRGPRRLIS